MENSKVGCLIIHGFGGSIYEVEPLAEYLAKEGFVVSCPQLSGHTGRIQDMKKATYEDWISSAEEELLKLKERADDISIVGFSMGGLIGVNLACKHDIKALVTINTPIHYWNLNRVFLNLIEDIKNRKTDNLQRYMRARKNSPVAAMYNFLLLLNQTKPLLCNVKCNVLLIQAKDDDTVRMKSVDYLYEYLSSENKKIKYYDKGGHQILRSQSADEVITDVTSFLKSLKSNIEFPD
ncbi:alpha/beta hydrolase [Lutispora thermophila]|uniref:Carboxylesterase n=1 Tax=Lutispora thermophila DSM 19022 TaxID=1122184 RepID=A0A1M6BAW6_9FIRM|nr:alpha/beta fold hydrolase [Lutispora thermophila]SHI45583.1 carboxylesterase [Lutispora thermophila DSM 19022]